MRPFFILFLIVLIFNLSKPYSNIFALEIDSVKGFYSEKGTYLIMLGLKEFPTQEILLALKTQKKDVTLLYEIEIYRKGFIRDERLDKVVYYQRAGYFPEKNVYFLEDNYSKIFFNSPNEVMLKLSEPPPLYISNLLDLEKDIKKFYFLIRLTLSYTTHFNEKLRYTRKDRPVKLEVTKKYVPL